MCVLSCPSQPPKQGHINAAQPAMYCMRGLAKCNSTTNGWSIPGYQSSGSRDHPTLTCVISPVNLRWCSSARLLANKSTCCGSDHKDRTNITISNPSVEACLRHGNRGPRTELSRCETWPSSGAVFQILRCRQARSPNSVFTTALVTKSSQIIGPQRDVAELLPACLHTMLSLDRRETAGAVITGPGIPYNTFMV